MLRTGVWVAAAAVAIALPGAAVAQVAGGGPTFTREAIAEHTVVAVVNVSDQNMVVYVDGELRFMWRVSTGLGVDETPRGGWNAYWLSADHRSSLFNDAPMPWAVFYDGNYAVHGTMAVDDLGRRASHGCVRLHPAQAEMFFRLVEHAGLAETRIWIVD